ncbi:F-box protein SKIP31 [Impatiens glandulifera]|uniref:F-box protein SKIP31 n=1 Tax=Impatiens glandulifera TaxID=253017 RepID=UPI001FB1650B|nr:F-box protein SKIP31 [Impatiens glandulifera]
MSSSDDDDDEYLAQFLESEVLAGGSDQESDEREEEQENLEPQQKKLRTDSYEDVISTSIEPSSVLKSGPDSCSESRNLVNSRAVPRRIHTGIFSKIPPEIFHHILKFLSSEDLVSCSLVCRFLSFAAADESLWRRLYLLRWGLLPPTKKLRKCPWKSLYIQRDEEDLVESVRSCPPEFKEYYVQMHESKRSQAPLLSQVNDNRFILDKTVADQISLWKSSKGLSDKVITDHACSGETCTYYIIENAFVCEKTGNVHVCDDNCRETILDPSNELFVCTISGYCSDRLLSPAEMEPDTEMQQSGADEAEPFMGSGRFARAYLLGYNCADEKELEQCLRFC